MSTLTSREFNQDTGRAKREALKGLYTLRIEVNPLTYSFHEEYQSITGRKASIGELLSMDGAEDIEFVPGNLPTRLQRQNSRMYLLDTHVVSELRKVKSGKSRQKRRELVESDGTWIALCFFHCHSRN